MERKQFDASVPAHGFTTVFYLATRHRGAAFARRVVGDLLGVFDVARVDETVIRRALALEWPDFEDAVCAAAAEACGCTLVVTRDPAGFRGSPVPVVDPLTALALLDRGGPTDRVSKPSRGRPSPRARVRRSHQASRSDRG